MVSDVIIEDARWQALGLAALAERAAGATLTHLGLDVDAFEISILACDDARIMALNSEFRDKTTATNVLSWPSAARGATYPGVRPAPPEPGLDSELGDIAISYDTCAAEARAMGLTMTAHTSHLIVHGVLHLLGYDHIRDEDATLMEGDETAILGKLGFEDPYGSERQGAQGVPHSIGPE